MNGCKVTSPLYMIEPVELKDFFITFFSAALIIMAGASYALLFAWSKVNSNRRIKISSYVAYSVLLVAVYRLSLATHLTGHWQIISYLMVIGYFFAPIGIWYLCKKTHDDDNLSTILEEEK